MFLPYSLIYHKNKNRQLSRLAGVTPGRANYISEYSQYPRPVYQSGVAYDMDERSIAVETPISAGEMDITLTLQLIFAIGN